MTTTLGHRTPPPPRRRGLIIGLIVGVIVLLMCGVGTSVLLAVTDPFGDDKPSTHAPKSQPPVDPHVVATPGGTQTQQTRPPASAPAAANPGALMTLGGTRPKAFPKWGGLNAETFAVQTLLIVNDAAAQARLNTGGFKQYMVLASGSTVSCADGTTDYDLTDGPQDFVPMMWCQKLGAIVVMPNTLRKTASASPDTLYAWYGTAVYMQQFAGKRDAYGAEACYTGLLLSTYVDMLALSKAAADKVIAFYGKLAADNPSKTDYQNYAKNVSLGYAQKKC